MIIIGTREVPFPSGHGTFFCPACIESTSFDRIKVRKFLTVYFVPLLPLQLAGEYIECRACRRTYSADILDSDTTDTSQRLEAEFHKVVRRLMVMAMQADEVTKTVELSTIRKVYHALTAMELTPGEVAIECAEAQNEVRSIAEYLRTARIMLNVPGKEMVVRAALTITVADGELHEKELCFINQVGMALDITPAHLKGIIQEMLDQEVNGDDSSTVH